MLLLQKRDPGRVFVLGERLSYILLPGLRTQDEAAEDPPDGRQGRLRGRLRALLAEQAAQAPGGDPDHLPHPHSPPGRCLWIPQLGYQIASWVTCISTVCVHVSMAILLAYSVPIYVMKRGIPMPQQVSSQTGIAIPGHNP